MRSRPARWRRPSPGCAATASSTRASFSSATAARAFVSRRTARPRAWTRCVYDDVDVLLAAAERHRIGLCLVLFDAGLVAAPSVTEGVLAGGHADAVSETAKREALLEHVVVPLLRRYGTHPAIDAWDIFDEPECATQGLACPHPARPRGNGRWAKVGSTLARALRGLGLRPQSPPAPALVPSSAMRAFLGAAVQAVHHHTRSLATVGLASTANMGLVEGLGLDFYQAHWWEAYGDAPLRRAAADLRLDRPLVLGAFPASTAHKSVKTVLDTARCAGYGGAFVWSLRAVDACGALDGQLAQWALNHACPPLPAAPSGGSRGRTGAGCPRRASAWPTGLRPGCLRRRRGRRAARRPHGRRP